MLSCLSLVIQRLDWRGCDLRGRWAALHETFEAAGREPSGFVLNSQALTGRLAPLRFKREVKGLTLFLGSPQVEWNRKPPVSWQRATD